MTVDISAKLMALAAVFKDQPVSDEAGEWLMAEGLIEHAPATRELTRRLRPHLQLTDAGSVYMQDVGHLFTGIVSAIEILQDADDISVRSKAIRALVEAQKAARR